MESGRLKIYLLIAAFVFAYMMAGCASWKPHAETPADAPSDVPPGLESANPAMDVPNTLEQVNEQGDVHKEDMEDTVDMLEQIQRSLSPVYPGETMGVLDFLYKISGEYTVAGIHNREPNNNPLQQTSRMRRLTGVTPGLWSGDFLFSTGDIINRQKMIETCKEQWEQGAIVNLMLHVTAPGRTENGQWRGDVLCKLTNAEWLSLITEDGDLNIEWKKRLDGYSEYFQYLKDNDVTVMFRPFHEMNQGAFWWGGRPGENGTAALYRLTHDYMVNEKGLDNIIWVWNMQDLDYNWAAYNPGDEYWDVVSVDFYNGDGYTKRKYDTALAVAGDKPIGIGECDKLPAAEELLNQPRWAFFMSWAELTFNYNDDQAIQSLYGAENVLVREELPGLQ
jgi:hypothetical protein